MDVTAYGCVSVDQVLWELHKEKLQRSDHEKLDGYRYMVEVECDFDFNDIMGFLDDPVLDFDVSLEANSDFTRALDELRRGRFSEVIVWLDRAFDGELQGIADLYEATHGGVS